MPEGDAKGAGARSIFAYFDLGLRFALSVLLACGAGYLLDRWLHTLPLFLLVGLILGAVAGFVSIYRAVFPSSRNDSTK